MVMQKMWSKGLAAIFGGCLLSTSMLINLNLLLPLTTEVKLLVSLLTAFALWIAIMIWCFTSRNAWQAWARCAAALMLSGIPVILEIAALLTSLANPNHLVN